MSKRNPGQSHINLTFYNNLRKANTMSPHFNKKTSSIYIVDANIRKLYLPSIKKNSNNFMKLPKSQSQDNIYIPMDQTQFSSLNQKNIVREQLLLDKISLTRIESKINDMNKNNKQLMKEREENLKIIKEIINSNNPPNKDILLKKIQYLLDNKKSLDMSNLESIKFNFEDKSNEAKTKNSQEKIKINISPINALNDKTNSLKKIEEEKNKNNENRFKNHKKRIRKKDNIIEENKDNVNIIIDKISNIGEQNNNIEENENKVEEEKNFEQLKEEKEDKNKEIEKKKKEAIEYEVSKEGVIENIKIEENNNINNNSKKNEENKNQDNIKQDNINKENINQTSNKQNSIEDIKEDSKIKVNTISDNNTNLVINKNIALSNNLANNISKEEPINSKGVIEEEKDMDNFNQKEQSAIFGKSFIYSQVFTKMKAKSELSQIKHQIINIQQKLRVKEDEIEDIKNRTTMKSLMFNSIVLNKKMIRLQKIRTKNQEFEYSSIPLIKTEKGNLINELDYYTKKHKSYISQNKEAEESYLKAKNEFDVNNKTFSRLELKSEHLRYKYNALKLRDAQKQIDLDKLKKKINEIENMKSMLESDKNLREKKKKEIEETKKKLEERKEYLEKVIKNKDKLYQKILKLKKEIKNKIGKKRNELNNIQQEIKDIEKKILLEIDKYQYFTRNNKKFINLSNIYQIKNSNEFIEYIKELGTLQDKIVDKKKEKRFHKLLIEGNFKFYKIAQIKHKPKKKQENILPEHMKALDEKLEYFINSKGELELQKDENDTKKEEKEKTIEENNKKKEENNTNITDIKEKNKSKKEEEKKFEDENNEKIKDKKEKEREKKNEKNKDEDKKEKKDKEIKDNDDKEKGQKIEKISKKGKNQNNSKESSMN